MTAYLVSGDEDVREGVAAAQALGVRVVLVGVESASGNQARTLVQEADEAIVLGRSFWDRFFQPIGATATSIAVREPPAPMDAAEVASGFVANWLRQATAEQIEELLRQQPVIPSRLDARLLRAGEEALGSLRGRPELKRELRAGFWVQLRGGLVVVGGGRCG